MAANPSTIGLSSEGNPTIPLVSKIDTTDMQTVMLTHSVTVAGAGGAIEKRKAAVPFLSDQRKPELLLRLIQDFEQTCPAG